MSFAKKYNVYINDIPIKLEKARVSSIPLNRHWPGHQRPLDQTEITAFASFDLNGKAKIKVECDFDFQEVIIRPLSLKILPEVDGKTVTFTIKKPCQTVVEFDGISGALHLFANPPENDEIPKENVFYFGPGEHDAGKIILKSNQTIYIDSGATVYGQIYGKDVENVKIIGKGILDHSKIEEVLVDDTGFIDTLRPSPIMIEYGKNILIKDIIVRDSDFLAVRPICCENVHIDNIKIIGNWRYNSDGIDPINCKNTLIENCFVRSFDDSFCIKGFAYAYSDGIYHNGKVYNVSENITYRNCVAFNEWGKALEIGVDLCAKEIKNCRFENCDVIHAVGCAIDVSNADYAYVHDIVFDNIRIEYSKTTLSPCIQKSDSSIYICDDVDYVPPLMWVRVYFSDEYSSKGERGKIENITFNNINVVGYEFPESIFEGYDMNSIVKNIEISNLYFNDEKIEDISKANFRIREFTENISLK